MIDRPRDEDAAVVGRDDYSNGLPLVRDLSELIRCLAVAEAEMRYQITRLDNHVRPRTERETKYHQDLREGYRTGARYTAILRRYHEGRAANGGRNTPYREEKNGVDDRGIMEAFTEG